MLLRLAPIAAGILSLVPLVAFTAATDPDRDFSGVWVLDQQRSDLRALATPPGALLTVNQTGANLQWTESDADGKSAPVWIYHTDDSVSKYQVRDARMSSQSKWEGAALLINTIVAGPQNYVVMDRWRLSRDHNVLTIKRQIRRGAAGTETEAVLVYRNQRAKENEGSKPAGSPGTLSPGVPNHGSPNPGSPNPGTLNPRTPNPGPARPPGELTVPAGTKIPLALVNSLSTKHSSEGDRVYLQTVFPITIDGRIVIPRGSYVTGTLTEVKRPGRVKGRGDLFLRFDSLTLSNGATRDFRSRLGGADADAGDFDRTEGKIRGEGNKGHDAGTVAKTTSAGAGIGGLAGSAAGHTGMGVGIGAAAGAMAGLAAVLLSRGPELVLPKGTSFEMVLDRSLRFKPEELPQ